MGWNVCFSYTRLSESQSRRVGSWQLAVARWARSLVRNLRLTVLEEGCSSRGTGTGRTEQQVTGESEYLVWIYLFIYTMSIIQFQFDMSIYLLPSSTI